MDFVENHDLLLNRPLTVLKETEVTSCKTVIFSRGESAFESAKNLSSLRVMVPLGENATHKKKTLEN